MATDLGVSITVSAVVGGALSGLTNIGKAVDTLKTATDNLSARQKELGQTLERNKDRLDVSSAKQLWQEYDKIGASVSRLKKEYQSLQQVQLAKDKNNQQWEGIKGQWKGALAAAGTLFVPVRLAVEFESAMADVRKVVDFDTLEEYQGMQRDILNLSRKIPMTGKELAAIVAAGGQSGVAKEHLTGFAADAAKMGVAFDMAAGQAGEAMATLSNVLQIPIPKISSLGDAINHLSDNANSKASDIVNVLTRAGSDIKQLGMTETQGAAWGSTFLSMGKAPELAAQAIKGMVTSLSVLKAGKGEKYLKQLGLSTEEFAKAMNQDAKGAMLDLLSRVKQLDKDAQFPMLMNMFGQQYADDALLLANNVSEFNRQLELLEERDASGNLKYLGSMQREFENRSATTANQFQLLKNGLTELGIAIGSILLPAANSFLSSGIKIANTLADWSARYPVLTKAVIGTVASLLAFRVGMFGVLIAANRGKAAWLSLKGAVLSLKSAVTLTRVVMQGGMGLADVPGRLGTFVRALSAARAAMAGFGLSSLVAMWPVVLVVGAVALAAFLIYKYWKPLKAFFAGLWDGLMQGLAPLKPAFDALAAAMAPFGQAVMSALGSIWSVIQPLVQPLLDWFGDFFTMSQVAEGGARNFGQAVGLWIGQTITSLVTFVSTAWANIIAVFSTGIAALLNLILTFSPVTAFMTAFQAVWTWFSGLGATFMSYGSMMIDGLVNGIRAGIGRAVAAVQGVVSAVKSAFTSDRKGMGIHSPSRVFAGYGGYMTEGLAVGIKRTAGRPLQTVGAWAGRLKERFGSRVGSLRADLAARISDSVADFASARTQQAQAAAGAGGITVNFNPTINAPGGDPGQIQTALQMGLREFETLFNRMMADRERRAY